jgi:hypothetical protein
MNAPITSMEVHDILQRLKCGKSPGMRDGVPPELLKFAYPPRVVGSPPTSHLNPLVTPLTAIFNHLLDHSVVLDQWSATLITLLFKKGDPTLWANYRPIAIVQLLSKVYAMIMHQRLSAWAESEGVREPAQTGFRPHQATTHHAFVLQHHITRYKRRTRNCIVASLTLPKLTIPFHDISCGSACMTWGFWERSNMLSSHCMMLVCTYQSSSMLDYSDPIDAAVGVKQVRLPLESFVVWIVHRGPGSLR